MQELAFEFKLYVIGSTQKKLIGERLRGILSDLFTDKGFKLEVIDLLEHPALAERENIIATPLLVRIWPIPQQYVTGDFSDRTRLEQILIKRG